MRDSQRETSVTGGDPGPAGWETAFLDRNRLPSRYLDVARRWFAPLASQLVQQAAPLSRPLLVGVNGSQGSGKSTLCDYLCAALHGDYALESVALSLDDFYLAKAERARLARQVHPLLATRGVPGTHDMALLVSTLSRLRTQQPGMAAVEVPRFDKAIDDRAPPDAWDRIAKPVQVILLEGWCLGAQPSSSLTPAINALEAQEDAQGVWRSYVNAALQRDFVPLYEQIDTWVMLRAPSFDCVYGWRLEQEHKLAARRAEKATGIMTDAAIARFIQFYERLTRACLTTLPDQVDVLYSLDPDRAIVAAKGVASA